MTFGELIQGSVPYCCGKQATPGASSWFGASVYHPDWQYKHPAGFIITISLQGALTPCDPKQYAILSAFAARYICIERNGVKLWESWTGEIPDEKVLDENP